MSLAHGSTSTAANGATSITVSYPSSVAVGDLLLLFHAGKYPANPPSNPSGWTPLGSVSGGAGASGIDSGEAILTAWYRIADSALSGTFDLTITGGNTGMAWTSRFTCAAGKTFDLAFATGTDTSGGTSWSALMTTNPGITAGDYLAIATGMNGNVATSNNAQAFSASGLTMGTLTEHLDGNTSTGQDCAIYYCSGPVSSGTASAAGTFSMTSNTSGTDTPAGATMTVRIREVDPAGGHPARRRIMGQPTPGVRVW